MPIKIFNLLLSIVLIFANLLQFASVSAQTALAPQKDSDLAARLAAIEQAVEARRQALGIPGLSLAIVKGDETILLKGFGMRDLDKHLPVTPDTLFAIGSATKAFTAMLAVMSADEAKLSLDDSPKKFLPYFRLQDAEADAQITIRDLLSHRSGLNRTDLAMVSGELSREELIKVAGLAKPAAKLREKFLYQNIMYTAAGEAVAKANGKEWDQLVTEKLLKPLGMRSTTLTMREMQQRPDYSLGYDLDFSTKQTRKLKMVDLIQVAPCGAINSNARDMSQWLRLMINSGQFGGKRMVSEQGFNQLLEKQISIAPKFDYGLGWFLREWQGHKVVEHGGNIDGFNAMVTFMPDEKIGVVLLTNVSISQLDSEIGNIVWSNLLNKPEPVNTAANNTSDPKSSEKTEPKDEAGSYLFKEAGISFEVKFNNGQLTLLVPGQPEYKLENIGGRRYKFADPAPAGFFVTFRAAKGNEKESEMFLEQPQGNFVLARNTASKSTPAPLSAEDQRALKELMGNYENEKSGRPLDISERDGRVMFISSIQPPRTISVKSKDIFTLEGLPDTITLNISRDESNKITGFKIIQPNAELYFRRLADSNITITVDELMAKVIEAAGGEANLRKHTSMVITAKSNLVHQGLTAESVSYSKAPNLASSNTTLFGLGKKIATMYEYFDGNKGGFEASFGTPLEKTGSQLADTSINSDFYQQLNWKQLYKTVQIKRISKIGDENVYVVVKIPEKGHSITEYISTKSFLLLRRDSLVSAAGESTYPYNELFSDHRTIDGVVIPFKIVSNNPEEGDTITEVVDVKFNLPLTDSAFSSKQNGKEAMSSKQ